MKRILLSVAVGASFALTGCGGDDLQDIVAESPQTRPASRIVFDPAAGVLNTPTDLLFAVVEQSDDGTLEVPDEIAGQQGGGTPDFSQPSVVLGALDGWSTQHPFRFSTQHPAGMSLDPVATSSPGAVRIFEGAIGGDLNDPDCTSVAPISGCKVGQELVFGVDFVTQASGNDVAVIPLRPLKGAQTYYVVVTDQLLANDGQALQPSSSYALLRQNVDTQPLATPSQLALQGLINSYEAVLAEQASVNMDSVIFTYTFTTQTTTDIIDTVKQLQIGGFAQALGQGVDQTTASQLLPVLRVGEAGGQTAFDVLAEQLLGADQLAQLSAVGLNTCGGLIGAISVPTSPLFATAAEVFPRVGALCAADIKAGSIDLPYYLSPDEPLTERWRAACTNGAALQAIGADNIPGLIANGTLSTGPLNELCQAASQGSLLDLDLSNLGIQDLRHITRFSPIPAPRGSNPDGTETLAIQVTVPNPAVVQVLASLPGSGVTPISKPDEGWPVAILQHGITSKKEDFLALTGALSLAGFATVAIDHPLHGSRGFTLDGQEVNASTGFNGGGATDYMNLASLLTGRDNLRQSIVDTLGLRLGLNALVDTTGGSVDINSLNVSFVGQSLGSITGIGTVATANKSLPGPLAAFDAMYAFQSAVFSVPGGGIAGFLLDSASFGPLIKGSLLAAASEDFQAFLAAFAVDNGLALQQALAPAFTAFAQQISPEQLAEVNQTFAEFVFAAQTVIDAGDPNNFAAQLSENTPVLMHEVVGGGQNDDGSTALSDRVIPNQAESSPTFAGTEPLAAFIGLQGVSSTSQGNGIVRFTSGSHSSLLNPAASLAATTEMQRQVATFLATGGNTILVTDASVIAN